MEAFDSQPSEDYKMLFISGILVKSQLLFLLNPLKIRIAMLKCKAPTLPFFLLIIVNPL